jgi:hypothetical protein
LPDDLGHRLGVVVEEAVHELFDRSTLTMQETNQVPPFLGFLFGGWQPRDLAGLGEGLGTGLAQDFHDYLHRLIPGGGDPLRGPAVVFHEGKPGKAGVCCGFHGVLAFCGGVLSAVVAACGAEDLKL